MSQSINVGLALVGVFVGTAIGLTVPASAQGQDAFSGPGGAGYFSTGLTYLTDLNDLNDALAASGYPESNRAAIAVGGGGYGVLQSRVMIGGEGFGVIVPNENSDAREVNYAAGMGFLTIGYQAVNRNGNIVGYPLIGIGGGGSTLAFEHTGAETFSDVLADPNRGATLVQGSLLLQVGGGIELRSEQSARTGGLFVGLRAGYVFAPVSGDWAFDEGDELRGGPDSGPSGLFVRLLIGGGGPQRVSR